MVLLSVLVMAAAATPANVANVVEEYCVACHSAKGKASGLSLAGFDAVANIDVTEKMIRKVRAGMMPPAGMPRPDAAGMRSFVESLESLMDAMPHPNPGS